jgi:glutamate synthase (NADPH/NADH) large chain/glutamate synthase (ferredoxin)
MVSMDKVLSDKEQTDSVAQALWHRGQTDEAQLKKLLEDHHRWTGSKRARALLDNWSEARAKFVKVFPNEYKRALGDMAAAESKPAAATKPKKAAVKS